MCVCVCSEELEHAPASLRYALEAKQCCNTQGKATTTLQQREQCMGMGADVELTYPTVVGDCWVTVPVIVAVLAGARLVAVALGGGTQCAELVGGVYGVQVSHRLGQCREMVLLVTLQRNRTAGRPAVAASPNRFVSESEASMWYMDAADERGHAQRLTM